MMMMMISTDNDFYSSVWLEFKKKPINSGHTKPAIHREIFFFELLNENYGSNIFSKSK